MTSTDIARKVGAPLTSVQWFVERLLRRPVLLAVWAHPDRLGEVDRALGALGAESAILLGYLDGTCDRVSEASGVARVRGIVERFHPDVVVGFGPDGVTGHPDHRPVARWTELAVGSTPFTATAAGVAWPEECAERMHKVSELWPEFPVRRFEAGSIRLTLHGEILERKLAAPSCRAHQVPPVQALLGARHIRILAAADPYRPMNRAAADLLDTESVGAAA